MERTERREQAGGTAATSTRERILDTAEDLFAERGYAGAAMRDIASGVGLTAGGLYSHFPGKLALYEAVLRRGLQPLSEILDELAESDWTPERLDKLTDDLVTHLAARPRLPRLITYEALSGGGQLARLARDWLRPLYARALQTFQRSPGLPGWDGAEVPLLIMALHNLILGYFAAIPMLREVLGEEPLSARMVEVQREFARKAVRRLLSNEPGLRPRGGGSGEGGSRE